MEEEMIKRLKSLASFPGVVRLITKKDADAIKRNYVCI